VCGAELTPFRTDTLTAHEFDCYQKHPELIPDEHREQFEKTLAWKQRSDAAKRAAKKRRKS